jgi:hypothetical protein
MSDYLIIGAPLGQHLAITGESVAVAYEQLASVQAPSKFSFIEIGWKIRAQASSLL